MTKSLNIRQFATATGVSPATVSLVFRNDTRVSAQTAQMVRNEARRLGYTHERRSVRSIPRKQPLRIKLYAGRFADGRILPPIYSEVLAGVEAGCRQINAQLVLEYLDVYAAFDTPRDEDQINGVLVGMLSHDVEAMIASQTRVPVVKLMGSHNPQWQHDWVSYDNQRVGQIAGDFFARFKHASVALIGPVGSMHDVYQQRLDVATQTIKNMGINTHIYPVINDGVGDAAKIGMYAQQWISMGITGVFSVSDRLTTLIYQKCYEHGIKPGQDITVLSCNNEQERISILNPQPYSIDIHPQTVGKNAVEQLLRRIEHPCEPLQCIQVIPSLDTHHVSPILPQPEDFSKE